MAKSRAQRKAEKRRRQEAQSERQPGPPGVRARRRGARPGATPRPRSPATSPRSRRSCETGADTEDYGEHVNAQPSDPHAETLARAEAAEKRTRTPRALARRRRPPRQARPTRSPRPLARRAPRGRKKKEKEQRKRERERAIAKQAQSAKPEKRRNPVIAFFISCWAELKKVQWPDRDTLVQASAVTLIFVVVMAAFLGGLDAIFNWMIKQIL